MSHFTGSTHRLAGSFIAVTAFAAASAVDSSGAFAREAAGRVLAADSPAAIAGSYIVKVRDDAPTRGGVDAAARRIAGAYGGRVVRSYAGTTCGMAPRGGARIHTVRVLGCQGSVVVAGVDWVAENAVKPAVADMSPGGPVSQASDDAVRRGIAAGVVFVLAAGNDRKDACRAFPARTKEAITVAASQRTDAAASFTNWGGCVDIWGPGVDITSGARGKGDDKATESSSGTSMAAPHVAGAAALYLEANPTATPARVAEALVAAATPDVITGARDTVNKLLYAGPAPHAARDAAGAGGR
ncbi:hypothetical protein GCM10010123_45590 [Pilimelia anulata]|uniref:Peptidase S8/S53 domain-containing protein n=1 Tax=Pilimelia anulata TaxID=53371 RepID=A0A8J3BFI8_9ACTN|nr:S8 family serine peptidase [Pilimelia anulata]GGK10497.1 hypothetical protein GCM10010123_45590 [Pilimelia anulata]